MIVKGLHLRVPIIISLLVTCIHMCIELLLGPHKPWEKYFWGSSFFHLWHHMYFILSTLSYFTYFMINYISLFEVSSPIQDSKGENDSYRKESSIAMIIIFLKLNFEHMKYSECQKKNACVWKSNLLALRDIASGEKMHSGLNHVIEKNKEGYGKVGSQGTKAAWVNHWCDATVSPTACEIHRRQQTCTHMDMHAYPEQLLTLHNLGPFCFCIWSAKVILHLLIIWVNNSLGI